MVRRERSVLAHVRRDLGNKIDESRFAQFLVFHQGERFKDYSHERGLRLIGDLPFSAQHAQGNWCWGVTEEMLASSVFDRLHDLALVYSRTGGVEKTNEAKTVESVS